MLCWGACREKAKDFQSRALIGDIKCSDAADGSYVLNNQGYTIVVDRGYERCLEDDCMVLHLEILWHV